MTEAKAKKQSGNSGIARFLPIVTWLPKYDRSWLRGDLIAGLTVAALVVPKSLGYAGIADVPIQHGLYAAAAGAILYALFGTSRQSATGPSSAWPPSPPAQSSLPASPAATMRYPWWPPSRW